MREILISSAVCVACLLVALASQLISPTAMVNAATPITQSRAAFELDPNDPNPKLFAMAPDVAPGAASDNSQIARARLPIYLAQMILLQLKSALLHLD